MVAPLFLAIAQIFMWGLTVDANDRYANEYVTTGLLILTIAFMVWCGIETWQFAMTHGPVKGNDSDEDENDG